jgi:hypothetical protein
MICLEAKFLGLNEVLYRNLTEELRKFTGKKTQSEKSMSKMRFKLGPSSINVQTVTTAPTCRLLTIYLK